MTASRLIKFFTMTIAVLALPRANALPENNLNPSTNCDPLVPSSDSCFAKISSTPSFNEMLNVKIHVSETISSSRSKKAKRILQETLIQVYESNPLEKCKLRDLINWNGFTFVISTHKEIMNLFYENGNSNNNNPAEQSTGCYVAKKKSLHISEELIRLARFNLRELISHELTHAYDAYSNKIAGLMLVEPALPSAYSYGRYKMISDTNFKHLHAMDLQEISQRITQDFIKLENLIEIVTKAIENKSLSQSEQKNLDQLQALVTLYDYKKTEHKQNLDLFEKKFLQEKYTLNQQGFYEVKPGQTPLTFTDPTNRLHDINKISKPTKGGHYSSSTITFDDTHPPHLSRTMDLLLNVKDAILGVFGKYPEDAIPDEIGAELARIFTPYSQSLNGKPTLAEWLFPNLSAHQAARAPASFHTCMKKPT